MTKAHFHVLFIKGCCVFCETMFTIGESRIISHVNDTELQEQQVVWGVNPRRGRFSIETPLENAD